VAVSAMNSSIDAMSNSAHQALKSTTPAFSLEL
jgi:hypothetical protein